jgi:hypothetical protein
MPNEYRFEYGSQRCVSHPAEWSFCGCNEIQKHRKNNVLIACKRLAELTGFESYTAFQETHKELVNESLTTGGELVSFQK